MHVCQTPMAWYTNLCCSQRVIYRPLPGAWSESMVDYGKGSAILVLMASRNLSVSNGKSEMTVVEWTITSHDSLILLHLVKVWYVRQVMQHALTMTDRRHPGCLWSWDLELSFSVHLTNRAYNLNAT